MLVLYRVVATIVATIRDLPRDYSRECCRDYWRDHRQSRRDGHQCLLEDRTGLGRTSQAGQPKNAKKSNPPNLVILPRAIIIVIMYVVRTEVLNTLRHGVKLITISSRVVVVMDLKVWSSRLL